MRIIEQSHEILHLDDLSRVERAGRTCYKSEDKIGCAKAQNDLCPVDRENCRDIDSYGAGPAACPGATCPHHSSHKFARMLIKRGHEAMIEHGSASVRFVTNRGVTHELVRHRLCAFGQESTRYVNYGGDDIAFIRPVWCDMVILGQPFPHDIHDEATRMFMRTCLEAELGYSKLLDLGWRPEQAREVLPNALKTEIVVTANFREWRHIFKLRAVGTTGKPHPQMQALMLPVLEEFKHALPALFDDLEVKE